MIGYVPHTSVKVAEKMFEVVGFPAYTGDYRIGRILSDCRGNDMRCQGDDIVKLRLLNMF